MKPTIAEMRKWWEESESHLRECDYENCDWYWAFTSFKKRLGTPTVRSGKVRRQREIVDKKLVAEK